MTSCFNWYNRMLQKYSISVTSITTGFCYGAGDYIAQNIEIKQKKKKEIDWHRFGVFIFFGLTMAGPIYYKWYAKINKIPIYVSHYLKPRHKLLNNSNICELKRAIIFENNIVVTSKVLADQLIFAVIYPVFFMIMTGLLLDNTKYDTIQTISQNQIENSIDKSIDNIKHKYFEIYKTDCAIWPMLQIINFSFVPYLFQPIYMNVCNVGWNTYLSFVSQE